MIAYLSKNKIHVNKEIAIAFGKMLSDLSCIFGKLCKRRRRLAAKFYDKLVLSCFRCLELGLVAGQVGGNRKCSDKVVSSSLAMNEHDKGITFFVEKSCRAPITT